jgi:hypothetical protein
MDVVFLTDSSFSGCEKKNDMRGRCYAREMRKVQTEFWRANIPEGDLYQTTLSLQQFVLVAENGVVGKSATVGLNWEFGGFSYRNRTLGE